MEAVCGSDMIKQIDPKERLIREVEDTPLLWNKCHNEYNNRTAMEHEWERIATILNKDKEIVKQKWRNLRCQFQREIKKVKVPFDNPTKSYIQYYRGKWIYFEHMLFLRDRSAKISSTDYSASEDIEIHDNDIIKEELIVFEDSGDIMFGEPANMYDHESDNFEKEPSVPSVRIEDNQNMNYQHLIQPKIGVVEEVKPEDKGIKRHATETKSEPVVSPKVKKLAVADASSNTEDNGETDDDLHFLKSLVPYLRKLSPIRKLLVRNEIQSLLLREILCENCKFGKSSPHHS